MDVERYSPSMSYDLGQEIEKIYHTDPGKQGLSPLLCQSFMSEALQFLKVSLGMMHPQKEPRGREMSERHPYAMATPFLHHLISH